MPHYVEALPGGGRFRVGGGVPFNQLGASLSREGWSGLEFAVGIPVRLRRRCGLNASA